jgi:hypothetical protein
VDRYPSFAEFHFQQAECQMHEGIFTAAADHYYKAQELDGLPVRMTAPWRKKLQEVAMHHPIPTLFAGQELLPDRSPRSHRLLDGSLFLDYVHPNLRAYYRLGMSAAERFGRHRIVVQRFGEGRSPTSIDFASAIAWAGFTTKDLALAYRRTADANRLMSRLRFESSRLIRDAQKYEDWSRRLESGQITPGQAGTESLK